MRALRRLAIALLGETEHYMLRAHRAEIRVRELEQENRVLRAILSAGPTRKDQP